MPLDYIGCPTHKGKIVDIPLRYHTFFYLKSMIELSIHPILIGRLLGKSAFVINYMLQKISYQTKWLVYLALLVPNSHQYEAVGHELSTICLMIQKHEIRNIRIVHFSRAVITIYRIPSIFNSMPLTFL